MKHVILSIDTKLMDTVNVDLTIDEKVYQKSSQSRVLKSQMILPLIEELLLEHQLSISDITAVNVYVGLGSFTGVRVGVTIANMIGNLLHIPVNNKLALALPEYEDLQYQKVIK
jgi:tRNA threonylcarbamoyladenosine biosynthesis protein TsaB